jgi:hypothetical protein
MKNTQIRPLVVRWVKNMIDKKLLLERMTNRKAALDRLVQYDFSGGLNGLNEAQREVKYWKEAIERGEFDYKATKEVK